MLQMRNRTKNKLNWIAISIAMKRSRLNGKYAKTANVKNKKELTMVVEANADVYTRQWWPLNLIKALNVPYELIKPREIFKLYRKTSVGNSIQTYTLQYHMAPKIKKSVVRKIAEFSTGVVGTVVYSLLLTKPCA